jgi:Lon protease-like protein
MMNFIPIFPLALVVYPGEVLNLHIFEPRYKQLINECFTEARPFGIPSVINNGVAEMGTLVEISRIAAVYEDGKMDISTKGLKVFRILELVKTIPDKLYGGAIVNYPDTNTNTNPVLIHKVIQSIRQLHKLLNVTKTFPLPDNELTSYDLAHHAGLSIEQEYEILGLLEEIQRLEYLKRHLTRVLPVVAGMENLKQKIQLNGHFKELKGFNFDF